MLLFLGALVVLTVGSECLSARFCWSLWWDPDYHMLTSGNSRFGLRNFLLLLRTEGNFYLSALICTASDPVRSRSFSPVLLLGPLLPPCPSTAAAFLFPAPGPLSGALSLPEAFFLVLLAHVVQQGLDLNLHPQLSHILPSSFHIRRSCAIACFSYCNPNTMRTDDACVFTSLPHALHGAGCMAALSEQL